MTGVTSHPVPVVSNTHLVNDEHYHSDYGYAFVAQAKPTQAPADGESMDLRWLTIAELQAGVEKGDVLTDVMEIYAYIAEKIVPRYYQIDAVSYSVDKPSVSLLQGK
jgi:hypothetical protein